MEKAEGQRLMSCISKVGLGLALQQERSELMQTDRLPCAYVSWPLISILWLEAKSSVIDVLCRQAEFEGLPRTPPATASCNIFYGTIPSIYPSFWKGSLEQFISLDLPALTQVLS